MSESTAGHRRVRIFVLGDTGVGKTALCKALCNTSGRREDRVEARDDVSWTVGCRVHVRVDPTEDASTLMMEFCDVGGSAKFEHSRTVFLRRMEADGVMFVHDLTWLPSRASIRRLWLPELVRCLGDEMDGAKSLESFFGDDEQMEEISRILKACRRRDFREAFRQIQSLGMKLFEMIRSYSRTFLDDEMQERADERSLVREVHIPILMVGMKRDIATREQRKIAKADLPPSIPYAEACATTAASNPTITSFIQQVIQHRKERERSEMKFAIPRAPGNARADSVPSVFRRSTGPSGMEASAYGSYNAGYMAP